MAEKSDSFKPTRGMIADESSLMKTNFLAQASLSAFTKANLNEVISCQNEEISDWAKTVATVFDSSNPKDQPDLLMMRSILVSEGMNLNDDIFLRSELMNARSTGAHKPINLEHQDENIVGHMLNTYAVTKTGQVIEGNSLPNEPVDIVNEGVVYSYIFPQLARDIEDMAAVNELFVSVEAWFDDYDYSVGGRIVERNERTSPILEEVLRMNGGEGYFKGNKVGRVLRNIIFGGVGIVAVPANPESLILEVAQTVNPEAKEISSPEAVLASCIIGKLSCSDHKDEEKGEYGHMNPMYVEDDKGNFIYPLFNTEWEAVETDINNGGTGTFHSHVLTIENEEKVFFMPDSGSEMSGNEAPEGMKKMELNNMKNQKNNANSYDLSAIFMVVNNVELMLQNAEAGLTDLDDQIVVLGQGSRAYARKQSLASLGLNEDQIQNRAERVIAMSDKQFNDYEEDLQDLVQASDESSEVNAEEETVDAVETEAQEVEAVEASEEANEEVSEVVETEQTDAAPEVEIVEEVSPEASEVVETEEVVEVVAENDAPEVDTIEEVVVEEVAVEQAAPLAEEAPVVETVVEVDTDSEEVEVDLDLIEPVTPEISFPSADQKGNTFQEQIHNAIVDIFNQKKKR